MSAAPLTAAPRKRSLVVVQAARFLVIGGTSVAIDLVCYRAFGALGVDPHLAKGSSYLAGMLFGFVGNKFWTFESQRATLAEPAIYLLLYAATLAVNIGVNAVALSLLGSEQSLTAFLVATGLTTVLNFLGMKFLAFRPGASDGHA